MKEQLFALETCSQSNQTEVNLPNYWFVFESNNFVLVLDDIVRQYYNMNLVIATLYLLLAIILHYTMKKFKGGFKIKKFSICWYMMLCILNTILVTRMLPHVLHVVQRKGFYVSLCTDRTFMCDVPCAFWGTVFPFLKILELGDVIVLILQKRPVSIYIWTHHILALIGSLYIYPYYPTIGLWYILVISMTHIPIYAYLVLREFYMRSFRALSIVVTLIEIIFLFLGAVLGLFASYFIVNGQICTLPVAFISLANVIFIVCFIFCAFLMGLQYRKYRKSKSHNITES